MAIEEKEKVLDEDRNKLLPICMKDETGEMTPEDEKELDRLMFRIDYQELFINKIGTFKAELDGKVQYAKQEFEDMSGRADKLLKQFGCDPNRYKPMNLFELLFEFARDFSEAYKRM